MTTEEQDVATDTAPADAAPTEPLWYGDEGAYDDDEDTYVEGDFVQQYNGGGGGDAEVDVGDQMSTPELEEDEEAVLGPVVWDECDPADVSPEGQEEEEKKEEEEEPQSTNLFGRIRSAIFGRKSTRLSTERLSATPPPPSLSSSGISSGTPAAPSPSPPPPSSQQEQELQEQQSKPVAVPLAATLSPLAAAQSLQGLSVDDDFLDRRDRRAQSVRVPPGALSASVPCGSPTGPLAATLGHSSDGEDGDETPGRALGISNQFGPSELAVASPSPSNVAKESKDEEKQPESSVSEKSTSEATEEKQQQQQQPSGMGLTGSTAPLRPFEQLLEEPACRGLKAGMARVFRDFKKATRGVVDEEVATVQCLLRDVTAAMRALPPWAALAPARFAVAKEDMARYVYGELHDTIFVKKAYQARDRALSAHRDQIRALVTPFFLDLKEEVAANDVIPSAVAQLCDIDACVSPFEKLACLFSACRILSFVLSTGGSEGSADDLLPLLIYVVAQSHLATLCSNIEFISRYADPDERSGEAYCFFVHFTSACTFLEQTTPESIRQAVDQKMQALAARDADKGDPTPGDGEEDANSKADDTAAPVDDKTEVEEEEEEDEESSDRAFVDSLAFVDKDASYFGCNPGEVERLLAEYKRLAAIADKALPRPMQPLTDLFAAEGDSPS